MTIQIRGGQIKSASITSTQLSTGIIDNSNLIGSSVVVSSALANDSVISAKIADSAIDNTAYLANGVVTAAKIDLTGSFNFSSGTVSVATPTSDAHAATKAYVDSTVQGVHWKESCVAASTANVDISSAPSAIDGVTLSANARVLLKDQSTASQNGIYVFASAGAAMSRSDDANTAQELEGAAVFIRQGSTHADQGFIVTTDNINLGTTAIVITQFTGLASITAGDGLQKSGSTISIDLSSNSGLQFTSGELEIKAGNGLELNSGSAQVKLNGSTLQASASGLSVGTITSAQMGANSVTSNAIADGSIDSSAYFAAGIVDASAIGSNAVTSVKINSGAVTLAKLAANAVDEGKIATSVAGDGLAGGGGSALSVNVDDATIEINSDSLRLKDGGISNAKLSSNCVQTANIQDDAISAAKIGAAFFQEGFQVSGSSTSALDLARTLDAGFANSVMVYINGLAALNMTAIGGSAGNGSEYTVAVSGGAGGVCRLSFGGNLSNGDSVHVVYFT
jgi:hypothetical protein